MFNDQKRKKQKEKNCKRSFVLAIYSLLTSVDSPVYSTLRHNECVVNDASFVLFVVKEI